MAYLDFLSDDDDFYDRFLTDESEDELDDFQINNRLHELENAEEPQLTMEQKLNNLYYAIMHENIDEVISLIADGVDINCVVRDGWSPILLAASVGSANLVRELISKGADIHSNKDKYTVLMAVCNCPEKTSPASKCLDIITQLIDSGIEVDATTRTRRTALMYAASNGRVEIVKKLLLHANIHAEDNQGWNALFWAVNDNQPDTVKTLLEEGFSPDKMDIHGRTPIDYARNHGYNDILDMFPMEVDKTSVIKDVLYEIERMFDTTVNEKPFYEDICCMLYGMKCEHLIKKFENVSLLNFLSMNDQTLMELDISIPYQRRRILSGLYNYHKHLYKTKSIPIIPKDSIYSTIDVSEIMIAAIRQLISMEASIRYISACDARIQGTELFSTDIVRARIHKLKLTATTLNSLVQMWDNENRPADLITKNNHKRIPQWTKWLTYLGILTTTVIVVKQTSIKYARI